MQKMVYGLVLDLELCLPFSLEGVNVCLFGLWLCIEMAILSITANVVIAWKLNQYKHYKLHTLPNTLLGPMIFKKKLLEQ